VTLSLFQMNREHVPAVMLIAASFFLWVISSVPAEKPVPPGADPIVITSKRSSSNPAVVITQTEKECTIELTGKDCSQPSGYDPKNHLSIIGLNPVEVLHQMWSWTRPAAFFAMHPEVAIPDWDEIDAYASVGKMIDYFHGRCVKWDLSRRFVLIAHPDCVLERPMRLIVQDLRKGEPVFPTKPKVAGMVNCQLCQKSPVQTRKVFGAFICKQCASDLGASRLWDETDP